MSRRILFPTLPGYFVGCCLAMSCVVVLGQPPANSDLALQDFFDRAQLGDEWNFATGDWKIVDEALIGHELKQDNHAAVIRRPVATGNAVYEFKFLLSKNCKAFHFGFDPAKGQSKKKGHLFSVIITPDQWRIVKHMDKNKPSESPNETLAEQKTPFKPGIWYTLRVTTWGPFVNAKIGNHAALKAVHPSFAVTKPALIFRCVGESVEIDDVEVWTQR
ncbi:MAG: hypothetical protein OSA98_18440 [Rubripirellula sp.]|nr:hypothetical protein [Rubripirellula sp.]